MSVIDSIRAMIKNHPGIDTDSIIMVNFDRFGESSLQLFIYAYTNTTDWAEYHAVKQDVLLKALECIHGLGADVAVPARTLNIANPVQLANN